MDPKARAEARRQAILGRGAKRLEKLTSSARGEERGSYEDPLLAEARAIRPSEPPSTHPQVADLPTHPHQFLESLNDRHLEKNGSHPSAKDILGSPFQPPSRGVGPDPYHPFSSMLSPLMDQSSSAFPSSFSPSNGTRHEGTSTTSPRKLIIRFLPFIRLVVVILLSIFFLSQYDPAPSDSGLQLNTGLHRWDMLKHYSPILSPTIQVAPLFQSLLAFEISWCTLSLLLGSSDTMVPTLIKLILPLMPSPFSHTITIAFQYTNVAQGILDDFSMTLAIMGLVILFAG